MNLKKSYAEKYGYEKVITERNSGLAYEELDFLKLACGKSYTGEEKCKETALVIMYGKCTVKAGDCLFENVGKRKSVFDGPAETVYIGKDTKYTVTAVEGDVKIAVCKAPAEKYFKPSYISAENTGVKMLGKGNYVRKAAFNLTAETPANMLYIGEFWVDDGFWASYPPHKHDVDNMPVEGALDEIYYFEFDKPQGFGVQMVYSEERGIDKAYRVKTGDMVEIPYGYHPFTVAPGYKNYCLWIMAGKNRGLFSTFDEKHGWLNK